MVRDRAGSNLPMEFNFGLPVAKSNAVITWPSRLLNITRQLAFVAVCTSCMYINGALNINRERIVVFYLPIYRDHVT